MYVAIYARFAAAKGGIAHPLSLHGNTVYFGGFSETFAEAEEHAREVVRGFAASGRGCVLPRVFETKAGETLWDVMCRAQEWFERLIRRMAEADTIIEHSNDVRGRR